MMSKNGVVTISDLSKFSLSKEELKNSGKNFILHDPELWNEQEAWRKGHDLWNQYTRTKKAKETQS
jgi:hypothetical protein